MKYLLRMLLRKLGCDVVGLTKTQRELLTHEPWLHYRDLVAEEAITLPVGEISLAESKLLISLVGNLEDDGPIIEIGTLFGRSTRVMACFKDRDRELITVDNYSWNPLHLAPEVHYRITASVLSEAVDKFNVKQVRMGKDEFYSTYHGKRPALVFIDAIHTYEATKADIAWGKSVNAGIICGHDFDKEKSRGVVQAVHECGGPRQVVETLWVL
jgi:hypothetical protein